MLNTQHPILLLETLEEANAIKAIKINATQLQMPAFSWSITEGLTPLDEQSPPIESETFQPTALLSEIKYTLLPSFFILCDFHEHLIDNLTAIRLLREIAMKYPQCAHRVILLSPHIFLPDILLPYSERIVLPLSQQVDR